MSEEYLSSVAFITPLCLLGITSVVQVLRLGRKLAVTRSFELEDSLICLNFLFAATLNVTASLLTYLGLGKRIANVETDKLAVFIKITIGSGVTYSTSTAFSKAILASHFLRSLANDRPSRNRRCLLQRALMSLLALQLSEEVLITIFSCQPSQEQAAVGLGGRCAHQRAMWLMGMTLNLGFSLVLFVHISAALWKGRRLPMRQNREGLVEQFAFTLLLVAALGRTAAVTRIGSDVTYDYVSGIIWSSAEADAFIICLCLLPSKDTLPGTQDGSKSSRERKPSSRGASELQSSGGSQRSITGSQVPAESEPVMIPVLGLAPTPGEMVDWVERVQSFPTEGRPQVRMAESQMGTTSYAEAVPGRRGRRRKRSRNGSRTREEQGAPQRGIMVVTEVRREIIRDPDFPWIEELGQNDADNEARKGEEAVDLPPLDELPLPDGIGVLGGHLEEGQ